MPACVCEDKIKALGTLYHSPSYIFESGSLSEFEAPVVQPAGLSNPPASVPYHTVPELEQYSDHIQLTLWVLDMNSDPHGWAANSLSH